jgi:hypothetical protein
VNRSAFDKKEILKKVDELLKSHKRRKAMSPQPVNQDLELVGEVGRNKL